MTAKVAAASMGVEPALRPVPELLERMAGVRVAVLGEAMLDVYLEGSAQRLCREGPVPVVEVTARTAKPGGGANTAANARALGARVELVAVTGDDHEGRELRHLTDAAAVGTTHLLTETGRGTRTVHRVSADDQLVTRYDHGARVAMSDAIERRVIRSVQTVFSQADGVILSDYELGFFTTAVVDAIAEQRARHPDVIVVADSKDPTRFRRVHPTAVKPNWSEAVATLGRGVFDGAARRADGIAQEGERILRATGARIAAVTLDREGAITLERQRPPHRTYVKPMDRLTVGPGDTFTAAFTLALLTGASAATAAEVASAAAGVAMTKPHTATCTAAELRKSTTGLGKLIPADELPTRIAEIRAHGEQIVFTNGCFDILHSGHVWYLNQAKSLGNALIVALNDDDSVRRLKGAARPINRLEDRAAVLAALSCVDLIVPLSEDSATTLLQVTRPDVYVKGGDYTRATLPEAGVLDEIGARLELLPLVADHSTTTIIERAATASPVRAGHDLIVRGT